MLFCWDSIIDKKFYETTLIFHDETWQKMLTTEASNYSSKKNVLLPVYGYWPCA